VTLIICNFTPVPRHNYRVGAPVSGYWREALNSDAQLYGGAGQGNGGAVEAVPLPLHGRPYPLELTIPPLACWFSDRGPCQISRTPDLRQPLLQV
jgi:1,4-alpha-glucan branching enzyme